MKITSVFIALLFLGCDQTNTTSLSQEIDVPVIIAEGELLDTAYLNTYYSDPGADIRENLHRCSDIRADVTGNVNTDLLGTYYLHYSGRSVAGKPLATITRTIHVVENAAAFLSGFYDVSYTSTITSPGVISQTLSSGNYTATVYLRPSKNDFKIIPWKIGPEYIVAEANLNGNTFNVGFFNIDYHPGSTSTGTLAETRTGFTIESSVYLYSTNQKYNCKNIYTKQLVLENQRASK